MESRNRKEKSFDMWQRYKMYIFLIRLNSHRFNYAAVPAACVESSRYINLILFLKIWLQRQRNRTFVPLSGENTSKMLHFRFFSIILILVINTFNYANIKDAIIYKYYTNIISRKLIEVFKRERIML